MHAALKSVTERLPHVRHLAEVLFARDEDFREMCDEYQVCSDTLTRMENSGGKSAALRSEYTALRLRIEGELLRYMAEHSDK